MSLVKAHRIHGHLAARLDPLGAPPPGDPALNPESVGLTPEMMARIPASLLRVKVPGESFADRAAAPARRLLRDDRLRDRAPVRPPEAALAARGDRVRPLARAPRRRAARGDPRAARRGRRLRALPAPHLPRPEDLLDRGRGRAGADHRRRHRADGRRGHGARSCWAWPTAAGWPSSPTSSAARPSRSSPSSRATWRSSRARRRSRETAGDVKYHLGAEGTYITRSGRPVTVKLAANPSHLEQVNAVAEGHTRARQTFRTGRAPRHDPVARRAGAHPRRRRLHRPGRGGRDAQPGGARAATAPAARSTSSRTTRSASPPTRTTRAPRYHVSDLARASTSRSST